MTVVFCLTRGLHGTASSNALTTANRLLQHKKQCFHVSLLLSLNDTSLSRPQLHPLKHISCRITIAGLRKSPLGSPSDEDRQGGQANVADAVFESDVPPSWLMLEPQHLTARLQDLVCSARSFQTTSTVHFTGSKKSSPGLRSANQLRSKHASGHTKRCLLRQHILL